jgi:hypothetical protein
MDEETIKRKVAGRNMAEDLLDCIPDKDAEDPVFMASLAARLLRPFEKAPVEAPAPKPEPIARLGLFRFSFGQHADKPLDEIPLDYLDWYCRTAEETLAAVRAYLKHPDLESRRRGVDR